MKFYFALLGCICLLFLKAGAQHNPENIRVEIREAGNTNPKPERIAFSKTEDVGFGSSRQIVPVISGASLIYTFPVKECVTFFFRKKSYLAEPGDRVIFLIRGDSIVFQGKGKEKYILKNKIYLLQQSIPKPSNPKDYIVLSETDYLEWHDYLKKELDLIVPVIDSYREKLSDYAYHYVRSRFIDDNYDSHSDKFIGLFGGYARFGLTKERSLALYDTKYLPSINRYFAYVAQQVCGTWKPIMLAEARKYELEHADTNYDTKFKRRLAYLNAGEKIFKGKAKEMFRYKLLFGSLVKEFGFLPEVEAKLDAYFKETSFPEWKAFMKEEVLKVRNRRNARSAPDFKLTDVKGNIVSKTVLKGKVAIFDFWFTGCVGCVQMVPYMKKLEEEFKGDTNVVFLNVSIDRDRNKWLKSIAEKKYTSGTGINLYTNGEGNQHSMIDQYGITGYPSLVILDAYGRTVNVLPKLDPRSEAGKARMSAFIRKQVTQMKDGPYVVYGQQKTTVYNFNGTRLAADSTSSGTILESATDDLEKTLKIALKKELKDEPAVFERPEKLIALSDIEGNFTAFRTLLQKNKVIDENYNWIFGNGHLVFAGDMFDRGNQVTECLWLMYALEGKAKAAGGYVHYVLGNHEIMNLQGNHSYAQPKYTANSEVLWKTIKELYNEDSELGRWLRTKNIMERIGDLIFVHGGLGMEFHEAVALPISEINARARKYYADESAKENPDENVQMIFDEFRGPLWYRRYYEDGDKTWVNAKDSTIKITVRHPTEAQLDSILNKYDAKYIITGHTIVADTISTLYNNKVINTDVPHAKGKSEALLIEGNNFYRVNAEGKRWLLFREEEKKPNR